MYSNKASLKRALESLPINSLVAIAAELERNKGGDIPQDGQNAIDNLLTDVLNAAMPRLDNNESIEGFMRCVNWWYASHDSREWYQKMLSALEKSRG